MRDQNLPPPPNNILNGMIASTLSSWWWWWWWWWTYLILIVFVIMFMMMMMMMMNGVQFDIPLLANFKKLQPFHDLGAEQHQGCTEHVRTIMLIRTLGWRFTTKIRDALNGAREGQRQDGERRRWTASLEVGRDLPATRLPFWAKKLGWFFMENFGKLWEYLIYRQTVLLEFAWLQHRLYGTAFDLAGAWPVFLVCFPLCPIVFFPHCLSESTIPVNPIVICEAKWQGFTYQTSGSEIIEIVNSNSLLWKSMSFWIVTGGFTQLDSTNPIHGNWWFNQQKSGHKNQPWWSIMGIERDSPPQSDSPNSEKLPSRTVEETSTPKPIERRLGNLWWILPSGAWWTVHRWDFMEEVRSSESSPSQLR